MVGAVDATNRRFERAFVSLDQSTWATLRVLLGFGLLLFAQWPDPRPLASLPESLLDAPPGLPQLLTDAAFREPWFLDLLHVAGVAAIVAFIAGVRGGAWWVTGWALLAHSILFSVGKIDHTYLPWLFPAALATSGWGTRSPSGWSFSPTLAPAALLMSIAWLTAALPKIKGGWLDPSSQSVSGFLEGGSKSGPLRDWFFGLPVVVLEFVDWAVIALELALPVLFLCSVRLRGLAVAAAIGFHFSALAVFGIGGDGLAVAYAVVIAPVALRWSVPRRYVAGALALAALWRLTADTDFLQAWLFGWTARPEIGAALLAYAALGCLVLWSLRSAEFESS